MSLPVALYLTNCHNLAEQELGGKERETSALRGTVGSKRNLYRRETRRRAKHDADPRRRD